MKSYKSIFKESKFAGTVEIENDDCSQNQKLIKVISGVYFKLKKKNILELKPWSSVSNRYDIIPEDADEITQGFKNSGVTGSAIWDYVDVVYNFNNQSLSLEIKGFKINKKISIKY